MNHVKQLITLLIIASAIPAAASPWIDVEGGSVFTGYNDVRVPNDTGTRFSLKDDISPDTALYYRLQAGYRFGERHNIFALYAPLTVKGESRIARDIRYQGKTFTAGSVVSSEYRFDSYRLSYVYTFFKNDVFMFAAGVTGKIRDAEITLSDSTGKASKRNTGFVPLVHLTAEMLISEKCALMIDGDGLAAPQGRAEDFIFSFNYYFDDNLMLRAGYRILEGGSDGGGKVYTFAMFHYAAAGVQYRW
jgi:hypothetical protein